MSVTVGFASEADVERACAISNAAAATTAASFATSPEDPRAWIAEWQRTKELYPFLVARAAARGGAVVGFARATPHRARGAYAWTAEVGVYVDPSMHNARIGTALYTRLLPLLEAQGYVTLLAGITSPNPASERLHAAFGFTRCGTYHRAGWKLGAWHDVGYWERQLQTGDAPPRAILKVADIA
ncbi:MAG: phosphinothricin acetyltransferase [Myxococcaceae bacterium]|nr:phosphinothricin acetyltransferase [Myxococcaceae bacterium]